MEYTTVAGVVLTSHSDLAAIMQLFMRAPLISQALLIAKIHFPFTSSY